MPSLFFWLPCGREKSRSYNYQSVEHILQTVTQLTAVTLRYIKFNDCPVFEHFYSTDKNKTRPLHDVMGEAKPFF